MSEADLELAREFFARLNEGGVDAVAANLHPDFEFTTPPELASEPGTYRGAEGLRAWYDSFYEAMDEVRVEPSEFVQVGDGLVAAAFTLVARGRSTGLEFSQNAGLLMRMKDGLAHGSEIFATLDEAVAAAKGNG
jgi:ketosteroid isomerase-like protein